MGGLLSMFLWFLQGRRDNCAIQDSIPAITWSDVKPSMIKIFLKVSKCDQFGKGVEIFIGRTNSTICPVAAILSYMVARGPSAGPFFQFADGSPLTKARFIGEVRSALALAGLDPSSYSGHSFRIGAATSATQAGLEDSTIKALGRWSSTAFLTYLRTPKQQVSLVNFRSSIPIVLG